MSQPENFAALHADAQAQVAALPATTALRAEFLQHLREHPDAMWRHGPAAHFTASMFIFDPSFEQVLLVFHHKAQLWLQPGGHFEQSDDGIQAAALREAVEETGVDQLHVAPVGLRLHRHALNSNFTSCREHLDLRFVAVAPLSAPITVSAESADVRWFAINDIPQTDPDLPDELGLVAAQLAGV